MGFRMGGKRTVRTVSCQAHRAEIGGSAAFALGSGIGGAQGNRRALLCCDAKGKAMFVSATCGLCKDPKGDVKTTNLK